MLEKHQALAAQVEFPNNLGKQTIGQWRSWVPLSATVMESTTVMERRYFEIKMRKSFMTFDINLCSKYKNNLQHP